MNAQAKQFELEGVEVTQININPDERGLFAEVMRKDWNGFENDCISQVNLSVSYPGTIRAWHRHTRAQVDYFLVLQGAIKIVAYDDDNNSKTFARMVEIIASEDRLQIVRIPGHYWHGTKTISDKPSLTIYFVNNLYDYENPDELRRPWNDRSIINPQTEQAYDWNMPAHK